MPDIFRTKVLCQHKVSLTAFYILLLQWWSCSLQSRGSFIQLSPGRYSSQMSFGHTAYVQNSHDCIHKHTPLRPYVSRSTDVCSNATVTAGDVMALTRTRRERMFLTDNSVQLQKKKMSWQSCRAIFQVSPNASFHVKLGKREKFQILNILNSCFVTAQFSFIQELLYGHYQSGWEAWGERKETLIIFPRHLIL